MKIIKLTENFSIEDNFDDLKITGSINKESNGSVSITAYISKEDDPIADCSYYAKEKVSFNINSVLEYRKAVVNYFNNLIDTVLNNSTLANL